MKADIRDDLLQMVADLHGLAIRALECHWNVYGPHFGPLHALFGDIYSELLSIQDTIAERVRALNGLVPATPTSLAAHSQIPKESIAKAPPSEMITALLSGHKHLTADAGTTMRTYASDSVTVNMLQDIVAKYDKRSWALRMLLKEVK